VKSKTTAQLVKTYWDVAPSVQKTIRRILRSRGDSITNYDKGVIPSCRPEPPRIKLTNVEKIYQQPEARQKLSKYQLLDLLAGLFKVYNVRDRFPKKLETPRFRIGYGKTRLGTYKHGRPGEIMITERLFYYSKWKDLKDTIIHEMSHQYVDEILEKSREKHGPIWKQVARKAGCTPASKSYEVNTKSDDEILRSVESKIKRADTEAKAKRIFYPQVFQHAKYYDSKKERWIEGMLACQHDKKGKRWALVEIGQYLANPWITIPTIWLHETKLTKTEAVRLKKLAEQVQKHTQTKKDRRSRRKTIKNIFGRKTFGF